MLSPLIRFIFPKACLYCHEIHSKKTLLCERCVIGLDLIFPRKRCESCFRECAWRKCPHCHKIPSPWYKAGALFTNESSGIVLLSDPDRFAKEIAAFFIIQYVRMRWPIPEAFQTDAFLKPIASSLQKFLPLKKASPRKDYAGKKILYLTKTQDECILPQNLLGARIHLISYIFND